MPVFRYKAIVGSFFLFGLFILAFSVQIDLGIFRDEESDDFQKEVPAQSVFRGVDYFFVREASPFFFLKAHELYMDNEYNLNQILRPQGTLYLDEKRPFHFTAEQGRANQKMQTVFLEGNAHVFDHDSHIYSEKAHYDAVENLYVAQGNVRSHSVSPTTGDQITVTSLEAKFWPKDQVAHYFGDVKGDIQRKRAYEDGVNFATDKLLVELNKSEISLEEKVTLIRGQFQASSHKAKIFLENYNKKLKYYALYDDVKILEKVSLKGGQVIERKAFGENLEGHMRERKVVLTGSPKVIQGKDVIKGNRITLIENNEVIEVDDSNSRLLIKGSP